MNEQVKDSASTGAAPASAAEKKKPGSLGDNVAKAFGAVSGAKPAADELSDRETGSPGPSR